MRNPVLILAAIICALGSLPGPAIAAPLQKDKLQIEFQTLTRGFDGRVGICAQDETGLACVNGDQRFSLQSVMKLLVGLAVMDAVDHRGWRLDEEIVVRKEDLSLYVQPIAELVRLKAGVSKGWKVGHKTGTSGTWEGVTAATNDVGLLTRVS